MAVGWDGSSWIPGQCSPVGWGCLIPLLPVPVPHGAIPKLGCEVPKRTKGSFCLPSKRVSRGIALKAPQHAVLTVGFAGGSSLCTPPAVARGAWAPFGAGRDEDEDVGMMSACRNSLWRGARPQLARLSFALVLFLLKCSVLLPIPHLAPWTRIPPSAALLIPRGLFTQTPAPLLLPTAAFCPFGCVTAGEGGEHEHRVLFIHIQTRVRVCLGCTRSWLCGALPARPPGTAAAHSTHGEQCPFPWNEGSHPGSAVSAVTLSL